MRYKCTSLLLGLLAGALHAGDGVLEINAACQSAGCFSGDDPGPPVQITQPGSYILTSNLSVNVNTTAILIESDNVTLNLNGFMLSGPVFCSGYPATCTQSGLGIGIDGQNHQNISVRNGTIRGMGADGIITAFRGARLQDLTISQNAGDGIKFPVIELRRQRGGLAQNIIATQNGGSGINGTGFETVTNSHALGNGEWGIQSANCSGSVMSENELGSACAALSPNVCDDPADCD